MSPTDGQPVAFRVEVRMSGRVYPGFPWPGYARVRVTEGDANTAVIEHRVDNTGQGFDYDTVFGIDIVRQPGETFRIRVAAASGGGYSTLNARMSFVNLPPNGRIVSCQGYLQDAPVSVGTSSWGKLKRLYR